MSHSFTHIFPLYRGFSLSGKICCCFLFISFSAKISFYIFLDRVIQIRCYADIFACLVKYRNNVLVDTDTVMDVWSLNQFSLKTFDILNLNPEISSHTFRAIDTFCISKKKRILSVISVKTNQRNIAMFCLSCDASRMIECQRVSKLRCLFCNGDRPWSAMLKKLAVFYIRMADGPVSEEASVSPIPAASTIRAVIAPWISVSHTVGIPSSFNREFAAHGMIPSSL